MNPLSPYLATAVEWVRRDPAAALLAAAAAYLLLLLVAVAALVRVAGMGRRQKRLLRGADGESLERMLRDQIEESDALRTGIADATGRGIANENALRSCLQRVGLVRYDAFENIGGGQSFSVALLDAENNGLVVSGLYSRHDMRVYAKPVTGGASPVTLTDEEREAILSAKGTTTGSAAKNAGGGSRAR